MEKKPEADAARTRERTTANEPIEGVDPGGTRPTSPARRGQAGAAVPTRQRVDTGDRNAMKGDPA